MGGKSIAAENRDAAQLPIQDRVPEKLPDFGAASLTFGKHIQGFCDIQDVLLEVQII